MWQIASIGDSGVQHRLIVVVGNVGSGKTTTAAVLSKKLGARLIPADELYKTNPFFPLALADRARWSLASDLWFLSERVKLSQQIPEYLEKSDVVVDSGLPMSWVYAHSRLGQGYFSKDEWLLYQEYYRALTNDIREPDEIVYLKAPVAFLRKRIVRRGREFEITYHSPAYLGGLQKSLGAYITMLKKQGLVTVREVTV